MSFKITGPGEYKLRDGGKVTITGPYTGDYVYQGYAWVGSGVTADGYTLRNHEWLPSGKFDALSSGTSHLDIVGPWQEFTTLEAPPETDAQLALRFNSGKPAYSALPLDLLEGPARVMAKGRKKYAKGNYRKGYSTVEEPLDSLMRHQAGFQKAVEADDIQGALGYLFDESGELHIDHIITSALLVKQTMQNLGWRHLGKETRMIKLTDGRCFPEHMLPEGLSGDLYVNGVKQEKEDV